MSEDLPIMGAAEAAEALGVELTRVSRYRREGRMPPTVADLASTPVWDADTITTMRSTGGRWLADAPRPRRRLLYGTSEAAAKFDVSKRAIARWREAGIFPEPSKVLAAGPIWTPAALRSFTPPRARRARAAAA